MAPATKTPANAPHPFAYHKELMDYRKDYDREVLDFKKEKERLNNKLELKKNEYCKLEDKCKYLEEQNKTLYIFKDKQEQEFKEKLQSKQKTINKLRGQFGGTRAENNKLKKENKELVTNLVLAREELIKTKNRNKFLESKIPKKTLEDIKAYEYNRKEVLKRSKKNEI